MDTDTVIERLITDKLEQLAQRPVHERWAAHAAVCGRTFVLAAPAWQRWPELGQRVLEGVQAALSRYVNEEGFRRSERLIANLEDFNVEDDGSDEWQRAIDTVAMVLDILKGESCATCVHNAMRWYLDGCYIIISNTAALSRGGTILGSEVEKLVVSDPTWRAAVEFVASL